MGPVKFYSNRKCTLVKFNSNRKWVLMKVLLLAFLNFRRSIIFFVNGIPELARKLNRSTARLNQNEDQNGIDNYDFHK